MPVYMWEAKTRIGETRKGEMEAASVDAVSHRLRSQQLQVMKVRKKPKEYNIRLPGQSGVSKKDLMVFTRQFAAMIDAGLPMVQCLDILANQMENAEFRKVIFSVKTTVESGSTLAEALRKHPLVFNRLFVNLVDAGETGGILDTILVRLADYIEKSSKLVKQVRGALIYPLVTLLAGVGAATIMLTVVIPSLQQMFQDMGKALPVLTQFVIDLSGFVMENIAEASIGIVAGIVAFRLAVSNPSGKRTFHNILLNLPGFGPLIQKVAVAKFTRTMGTMLTSGVPILDALEIVAGTSGNVVVEEGLLYVRDKISEGKPMSQPLSELKFFPSMVVQMIAVGESTGAMDTMLNKIADFYDEEVDAAIGTLTSLLEPVIMGGLAIVLGGLVVAMYLPIFGMIGG